MLFSRYIAYFDESGDHGLRRIDPTFPVFVLCGTVFRISDYTRQDKGAFARIKFKHFGHDAVVFHSRTIRKRLGPFQILGNTAVRRTFMGDIGTFFANSNCTLIAAGIDKIRHVNQYAHPMDPYDISLLFCLERLYGFLVDHGEQQGGTLTCVFEKRGNAEDNHLANVFLRICAGANRWGQLPFHAVFADKLTNMAGLQIADLAAYPIARKIINPSAANPAYNAIRQRFRRSPGGRIIGYGLKVFP